MHQFKGYHLNQIRVTHICTYIAENELKFKVNMFKVLREKLDRGA